MFPEAPPPIIERSKEPGTVKSSTLIALAMTAGGLASLAAQLAGQDTPWWTDLMSPFALHAALALLLAAIIWMVQERPIHAAITGAALAVQGMLMAPLYTTDVPQPTAEARLKLLHLNVHHDNDPAAIAELIAKSDADIVSVLELSRPMEAELAKLPPPWRRWAARPDRDAFGIGVWARMTATSTRVRMLDHAFPTIEAKIPWDGGELTIIAAHALPPVGEDATIQHRRHLAELGQWARTSSTPVVISADLNATIWSAGFHALSGLRSASLGHGYQGTWHAALTPFGIPIDHVMIPRGILAIEHEIIEIPGSDHRGLSVVLAPAR